MKIKKSIVLPVIATVLLVGVLLGGNSLLNSQGLHLEETVVDTDSLPISKIEAAFVYDVNNITEAVGISDFVFAAKVVSNDGTKYKDTVVMEDIYGKPKEVGTPYTSYTLDVLENIKGSLTTEPSIEVIKHGGIVKTKDSVILFENDMLPKEGKVYIFSGYAQKDGSILISGPNSNVLVNIEAKESIISTESYQRYANAVENETIPVQRERYSSKFEK